MRLTGDEQEQIVEECEKGFLREQIHPNKPLMIFNYSKKAEMEEHWNETTRMCRGLVLDIYGEVIIPCIPKFFNHGTEFAEEIDMHDPDTIITEKNDGYMIQIKNSTKHGPIVTSRGSFTSEMAEKARTMVDWGRLEEDYTYVCELCCNFPGDESIIVTRHKEEKLVCFCVKDSSGEELDIRTCRIPKCFERVKVMNYVEAQKYLTRMDVEGVVLLNGGRRVKVKTNQFLAMHRLISDIRKVRVWELLKDGKDIWDIDVPDEFMNQLKKYRSELLEEKYALEKRVTWEYERTLQFSKKMIALDDSIEPWIKSLIFNKRDGKPIDEQLWKIIRNNLKEENKNGK